MEIIIVDNEMIHRVKHYGYYLLTENFSFRKHEVQSQGTQAN